MPLLSLEEWQKNYVLPEGHCPNCKKLMKDDDYILRRDGKGYCQSCKTCVEKMRYRRSREYREKQKQARLKDEQRTKEKQRQKTVKQTNEDKRELAELMYKLKHGNPEQRQKILQRFML